MHIVHNDLIVFQPTFLLQLFSPRLYMQLSTCATLKQVCDHHFSIAKAKGWWISYFFAT
jgi:hypothetical protein